MDPAWLFVIALVALHIIEGLYWVRREAFGFTRARGGYRVVRPGGPFGNARGGFLLQSPRPPLGELFVVEPWPLTLGATRIWALGPETLGQTDPPPIQPESLELEPARRVRSEAKVVKGPGGFRVRVSSPALAVEVATQVRAYAAKPAAQRKQAFAAYLARSHDLNRIQERLSAFRKATRRLSLYASLWPVLLIGGAYGFFFVPAVLAQWRVLAAAVAALWLLSLLEFFFAHRRLYPGLRGDRALKLLMMLASPPAVSRARAWLARDLFAAFHPLAVGVAMLEGERLDAFVGAVRRDLRHPLGPDPEPARADLAVARRALETAHDRLCKRHAPDVDPFAPPGLDDPQAAAYCPRCQAGYRGGVGQECPDCPGVARVAAPAGGREP